MDKQTENRIKQMLRMLNERQKRIYLATEAEALGHGGISAVSRLTGVSRVTISQGKKELKAASTMDMEKERCRVKGGGRKKNN